MSVMTAEDPNENPKAKKAREDQKSLELAIAAIERKMGKGSIYRLSDDTIEPWPSIPSGALTLDRILGIGGLPRGRIVEIYGAEGAGKSTLALSTVVEAQKLGGTCAYIDVEHALNPVYMKELGVDFSEFYLAQPDSGEAALELMHSLTLSGDIDMVVIDSVAALLPQNERDEDIGKPLMAVQARLMSQALRKLPEAASKTNTLLLFVNQLRSKLGSYGSPDVTPGGRALDYAASVRIDVRKHNRPGATTANIQDSHGNVIGMSTRAKVMKNKMANPLKEAYFDIIFGKGIDQLKCLLELAIEFGIIHKSGGWLSYGDVKENGANNFFLALASDLAVRDEIVRKTNDAIKQ